MASKAACPHQQPGTLVRVTDEGFYHEIRRRARLLDIAIIVALPALLVAVHLGTTPPRPVFRTAEPTLASAYLANFYHYDPAHLLGNVVTYLFVVPTAYVLSVLSDRRRHFWVVFATFVSILPVLVSLSHLPRATPVAVRGFSGILMAFLGYHALIMVGYVATRFSATAHLDHAPLVFFIGTALISVAVVPTGPSRTASLALAASAAAIYLYAFVSDLPPLREVVAAFRRSTAAASYLELAVFGGLLFGAELLLGFTGTSVERRAISFYSHFVGYAAGFLIAYVALRTDCSASRICECVTSESGCRVHDSLGTRLVYWVLARLGRC